MDSIEYIKQFPDKSLDILYADPPYALGSDIIIKPDGKPDYKKASDFMSFSYKVCTDTQALKNNFDFDECSKKSEKDFDIWMVGSWGNVAVIALAPIPILWLIIYGLIKIYRWIRVGESAERC